MRRSGVSSGTTLTDTTGAFAFESLAPGDWHVESFKQGDRGTAVSALDAAFVLQAVTGRRVLDDHQLRACDVTGDGAITPLDATRILQFLTGRIPELPAVELCSSEWLFLPQPLVVSNQQVTSPDMDGDSCTRGSIDYRPLSSEATSQDFSAAVIGDCTGNWQPAGAGGGGQVVESAVKLGPMRRRPGGTWHVPVTVHAGSSFHALQLSLKVDPGTELNVRSASKALVGHHIDPRGAAVVILASAEPLGAMQQRRLTLELKASGRRRPQAALIAAQIDESPAQIQPYR